MMIIQNKIMMPFYLVLMWALSNVYRRFFAVTHQIDAVVFSIISLFTASIVLIIIGYKKNNNITKKALKEKYTWLFALFEILSSISSMLLFIYVNSTKGSLLMQFTSITAITYGIYKYKKSFKLYDIAGCLLISSGMFNVINTVNKEIASIILLITILNAIFITAKTISAEKNPFNLSDLDFKNRCSVTGNVILFTCAIMCSFIFAISIMKPFIIINSDLLNFVFNISPTLEDFTNKYTIISGITFGVFILSTIRYLYFYSSKLVSTDNLLIISALTPISTWFLEFMAVKVNILQHIEVSNDDLIWGAIITSGAIVMIIGRHKEILSKSKVIKV